ncbi:MAG: hypothetical protein NXI27_27460 [Alphaproteobacteria bacterium]|nr:hypothetical protein [Alphaproteobacteria bacterium]
MWKLPCALGTTGGIVLTLLSVGLNPATAADESREMWRLFVADQQEPEVTVIDPSKGRALGSFETSGYVTHLVASQSGKTLFAVQMDHDMVHVLKSGIATADHGEHADINVEAAELLPVTLPGERPIHVVADGDSMVQYFDREGVARVFSETRLLSGDGSFDTVRAIAPHHGIAVPMGRYFLMSEPDLDTKTKPGELPPRLGLRIIDEDGKQVGDIATCSGLHGEAHSAGIVAFGCAEGVLVVRPDGDNPPKVDMLAYRSDMPEDRVSQLLGGKAMNFFLGNYGADRLALIDPASETPFQLVDLPVRRVDFALDPQRVKTAYVFTEDGQLHALDVLSGEIVRSANITEPYSKDGHWRDPRPRLAVMGDIIAVTDPKQHLVRLIDAESFEQKNTIEVEGLPFNIVAVGGSGLQH